MANCSPSTKIKFTLLILLFFTLSIANAQENNRGALKTKDGVILYFNLENNSYTLNLSGTTDLSYYPFVKINDKWFEINFGSKSEFGSEPHKILANYMNWELDYLKNKFKKEIKVKNYFIKHKELLVNFWQYNPPFLNTKESSIPIKTTYSIDLINRDLVNSFSYASVSGNELEAKEFLLKLVDGIHFYKSKIDLNKLQEIIIKGGHYYKD
jgi:hypothetical protein